MENKSIKKNQHTAFDNFWAGFRPIIGFLFFAFSLVTACKKFAEIPPPSTELTGASVFSTNADASAAMAGLYTTIADGSSFGGGPNGISIIPGLSADEVALYPTTPQLASEAYQNALLANTPTPFWNDSYQLIYQANAAINNIPSSTGMTPSIKSQFLGEALFIRAYCYFYLVNFYGDVPLVTTTNYKINESLARTPQKQVYQQIVADLAQAQSLLGDTYLDGSGNTSSEHVRPNREAVNALLARVYLYTGDWTDAQKLATKVISSSLYTLDANLNQVFLAISPEAIWQLELPANGSTSTADGGEFVQEILNGSGPNAMNLFYMSNTLASSFENGDLRKVNWVDSIAVNGTTYYYPYKYKTYFISPPPTEYPMMLRYAEQFLVRGEAYAHQGQTSLAIADMNIIRGRAGLPAYAGANDTTSVLNAILHERQVELFTENGHRWFDLKRTGKVNSVMGTPGNQCALKGGTWNNYDELYPLPNTELQADHNLVQNPGYH